MKFTVVKEPIPFLIIDDTYTKDEQVKIFREIDFLSEKLKGPEHTASATNEEGIIKKNTGLFLESAYKDRNVSDILTINRKTLESDVLMKLCECHPSYNLIFNTKKDSTLLSYYGDNDSYFKHYDTNVVTAVTWFYKSPKNFTGGEFLFSDYSLNIELKHNRTVMFLACYMHEVTPVHIIDKSAPYSGRYTLSQFISME